MGHTPEISMIAERGLLAGKSFGLDLLEYGFGAAQGLLNVGADVLAPHHPFEFCPMHHLRRLLADATQYERRSGGVELARHLFEGEDPGRIDGRHVAQANVPTFPAFRPFPHTAIDFFRIGDKPLRFS
jgi:hypothetical protein